MFAPGDDSGISGPMPLGKMAGLGLAGLLVAASVDGALVRRQDASG